MMIYFENPNNTEQFISWNGSATFHVGTFRGGNLSHVADFEPTDVFTVYGGGAQGRACTINEAQFEASRHFKANEEDEHDLCDCAICEEDNQ